MSGILSKIMVCVTLAALIALAIPMGMMTASVVRGESPRQLAAQEAADDLTDEPDEPGEQTDQQTIADEAPKPEVPPDPGPTSPEEETPPKEETVSDKVSTAAPAKKSNSQKKKTQTTQKTETTQAAPKTEPKPTPEQEPEQSKSPWPKAVLGPDEAPCMVDGLDGYSYDYGLPGQSSAVQQTAYQKASSSSGGGTGNANNFNTYDNAEQQQTDARYVLNTNTFKFHYPHCDDVKKIAPQNYSTSNADRDDIIALGYSSCGHCNP